MLPVGLQQRPWLTRLWESPTMTTWASLATRSLNLFLLIPFILHRFEPAEISLWYLFATIIGLNTLFDLGLGITFVRFIAYAMGGSTGTLAHATETQSEIQSGVSYLQRVVGTQQVLFSWLTLGVLAMLATLGTLAVYRPIHFLTNPSEGWLSWGLVVIGTAVVFRGNAYALYLQGINRIAEFRRLETLFSLLSIGSSWLMLVTGAGLVGLVIAHQFWAVLGVWTYRRLCYQYNEGVFVGDQPFRFDTALLKEIWPSAWRSGLGVFMSYGIIQGSGLIYAQSSQVAQVSAYLFAMRLMQFVVTFSQAPFYSKLPSMARLFAQNDRPQITAMAQKGMALSHWSFVAGFAGVGLLVPPLMQLIGSQISFVAPSLWALMGLAYFVERYGAMHLQLYSITNHILWHIANGVTGTLYLILATLLYPTLSVYAFPVAMLAAYAGFYSWYSRRKSNQFLPGQFWKLERSSLLPFAALSLLLVYLFFYEIIRV